MRYNPEGDRRVEPDGKPARLKRLSDYLAARGRGRFMFELLVPPEKAQLDKLKGDKKAYDLELRPRLMVEAIQELQDRRRRAGCLEDRRPRSTRGLRGVVATARRAGASRRLHRSRPRRGRPQGPRMARDRGDRAGFHRLCRRPHRFLGSAQSPGGANKRPAIRPSPRSPALSRICGFVRPEGGEPVSHRLVEPSTERRHGGLSHATRNDRPRPDGSEHGAPPSEGRPPMRGLRQVGKGGGGAGEGEGRRHHVAGRISSRSWQSRARSG